MQLTVRAHDAADCSRGCSLSAWLTCAAHALAGGECGIPFERRMKMPLPGRDKSWYSFDFGPIHFLQYSTEHPFHPGTAGLLIGALFS